MKKHINIILVCSAVVFAACNSGKNKFDASGTFEGQETIVSSELAGKIVELNLEEGQLLEKGKMIGLIDTMQLFLKKKQLNASIQSLLSRQPEVNKQLAAIQEQITSAENEKKRLENLVKADAAGSKQLDDIQTQISVLKKQYTANLSSLSISNKSIQQDIVPLQVQIEQTQDLIEKSKIINPLKGIVLSKYAEVNEVSGIGKPIYKIAKLDELIFRMYVSGDQLPLIKIGQNLAITIDAGNGEQKEVQGKISWIADEAEFTPKTIQTKDERANLVYAVKLLVPNDGSIKLGMYGEVRFNQ
ncbi:MAG: HlyD family secretion protein [Bacteroidia bacterium]